MFAKGDWKGLGYESETRTAFTSAGIEFEEPIIKPTDRLSAAKEAAKYLHSQKKAVDITFDPKSIAGMTNETLAGEMVRLIKLLESSPG